MSAEDYFFTRTRAQFLLDVSAWQASFTTPTVLLARAFGLSSDEGPQQPRQREVAESAAPAVGQDTAPPPRRPGGNRTAPPRWYRQVNGRHYDVHDMDTRDPTRFAARAAALRGVWSQVSKWSAGKWGTGQTFGVADEPVARTTLVQALTRVKARAEAGA
jgi:hypothetical protein